MKKLFSLIILLIASLAFTACSESETAGNATESNTVKNDIAIMPGENFVDARDGKNYKTLNIAGFISPATGAYTKPLHWFAENLNYKTTQSYCYNNDENNCTKYGRLYNSEEAQVACPEGWRLPFDTDWPEEISFFEEDSVIIISPKFDINFGGFSLEENDEEKFDEVDEVANYWTIEKQSGIMTCKMIIPNGFPALGIGLAKTIKLSVRCVKDK